MDCFSLTKEKKLSSVARFKSATPAHSGRNSGVATPPRFVDNIIKVGNFCLLMKYLGVPSSGSIAGTTFSHNRAGQYQRNRRTPVNPVGTGRRATVRANFGSSAKGYAALTAAQQAAWSAYALGYPYIDSLGQSIKLTGQQMYVAINASLLNCGAAVSATPPVSNANSAPVVTAATFTHLGVMTITLGAGGLATDFICLAFSKPMSSGRSFNSVFWQQLVVPANSAGAATYGAAYVAQFGLPGVGQRVFYRFTPVNQYGVAGTPVIAYITVT